MFKNILRNKMFIFNKVNIRELIYKIYIVKDNVKCGN